MARMSSNPQTSLAGGAAALLLALFAFLGPEPISWPRAAVLVAGCFAIAALGIFARDARAPKAPTLEEEIAANAAAIAGKTLRVTVANAKDIPPTVNP